jgi:hypothetical protein
MGGTISSVTDEITELLQSIKTAWMAFLDLFTILKWAMIGLASILGIFLIVWLIRFAFGQGPDIAGGAAQVLTAAAPIAAKIPMIP